MQDDEIDKDHVPPKSVFRPEDREPLILPTHKACNRAQQLLDEKIGELIGFRHPPSAISKIRPQRLHVAISPDMKKGAVVNIQIDEAVWRWVSGFHAALYAEAFPTPRHGALVTPFPRARRVGNQILVEPLRPQHAHFVAMIKWNRLQNKLDRIVCNKGKLVYESVWSQADNNGPWLCFFGIDVYDWKDLGKSPDELPRGCAGVYGASSCPVNATVGTAPSAGILNGDPLDPFGL